MFFRILMLVWALGILVGGLVHDSTFFSVLGGALAAYWIWRILSEDLT